MRKRPAGEARRFDEIGSYGVAAKANSKRSPSPYQDCTTARSRMAADVGAQQQPKKRKASPSVPVPPLDQCLLSDGSCRTPVAGGGYALIDAEDHPLVSQYLWHMGGTENRYVVSKSKPGDGRTPVYLHRLVMKARRGELIDHRDGNEVDCRKGNLRRATPSQNGANRKSTTAKSGYCGVYSYPKKRKPWRAAIGSQGATYRGPYRSDPETAAHDYDALARVLHGDFATLNFPEPGERHCRPVNGGAHV